MRKRGNVLREPGSSPGLLMVEGQQFRFSLDGVWRSAAPPRPGQVVDVELDQNSQIIAITSIAESQLAKEQAEAAMVKAKEKGGEIFQKLVAKVGVPSLVAGGLLLIGWFFLATVSIQIPLLGNLDFTFWQVLGLLNSSNVQEAMERSLHPSAGIYGLLALIAFAGPFVCYVWKDRRAPLGGVAPLVFMLIVWVAARSSIQSAFGGDAAGPLGDMARQVQAEAMKAISLGMGAYLSMLVSLYFAAMATMKFLSARSAVTEAPAKSRQAAA